MDKPSFKLGVRIKRLQQASDKLFDLASKIKSKTSATHATSGWDTCMKVVSKLGVEIGNPSSNLNDLVDILEKAEEDLLTVALKVVDFMEIDAKK